MHLIFLFLHGIFFFLVHTAVTWMPDTLTSHLKVLLLNGWLGHPRNHLSKLGAYETMDNPRFVKLFNIPTLCD